MNDPDQSTTLLCVYIMALAVLVCLGLAHLMIWM